jgi:cellulose biosynthesis protein BcsQ
MFEQLQPYLPVLAAVLTLAATALGIMYKIYIGRIKDRLKQLESQYDASQQALSEQNKLLVSLAEEKEKYRKDAEHLVKVSDAQESLVGAYTKSQEELDRMKKEAGAIRNRIRKALDLEGAIWTQPIMSGTPPFRPLAGRRTPIVSVLNLKGGVGKTTITAYLGWAMAARGYRVLLLDLDLQGSLSSFFVSNLELGRIESEGRLLRHFMDAAACGDRQAKIASFAIPIPQFNERSMLVGTTDRLAYSELGLTFQWLLRVGGPTKTWSGRQDARMILRRALHAKALAKRFDLILLDCPPLVNLCCANALTASDFLLVPVTPNLKSIERVTPLLERVREVRETGVNPSLDVLGMVVNRHQEKELSPKEEDLLKDLPQHTYDILKQDVYFFDSTVPQRTRFRDSEDSFAPPEPGSELHKVFAAMAEELVKRLPSHCRQPRPFRTRRKPAQPAGGEL